MENLPKQVLLRNESKELEYTQEELDVLMPLIMKGDKLGVYQNIFGYQLLYDQNFDYVQPKVKKWVNSQMCNTILTNVVQIDANQYFPKIASMYLNLNDSNENLISTVCNKFTNLRDKSSGKQKEQIKEVVNCLIGYLVTRPKKYEKLDQELQEQFKRHRCTLVHQKITQMAFDIMDNLENILQSQNIEIIAFKTDSVFILDQTGNSATIVQDYFKSLGFNSKMVRYQKFMHAQSRYSEQDVCYYIGLTQNGDSIVSQDDEESEVNGIVKRCNRDIVKEIVSDILNGEDIDLNYRIQQAFQQEFERQLQLINTPEQSVHQIKKLIEHFGDQKNSIACLSRTSYQKMYLSGPFKKVFGYKKVDWKYNSYEFNQYQQRKALEAFNYILNNNRSTDFTNPTMFESEYAEFDDLQEMIHVRVDHNNQCSKKSLQAYDHIRYSTLKELKNKPNVSIHEYFHLNHGRLFIDVDCDKQRDFVHYNKDIEIFNNEIINSLLQSPFLIHQGKIDYQVVGYKNNEKLSLHIVFDLVMSFRVQQQIMISLSSRYGKMIDSDVNRQGKTLRLPYFEKVSEEGISSNKMLKPLFNSKEGISNYFICHMLDGTPVYNEPEFALDQYTLSITNKLPIEVSNKLTDTIEDQLFKQRQVKFIKTSILINRNSNHYGKMQIVDYYDKYTKCPFCSGNHTQIRHRTILMFELIKKDGRHFINIKGGYRCQSSKYNNPLRIEISSYSLKSKSNWLYNGVLKPNFSQQFVTDYLPAKLNNKTIYIVISDMGSGKSKWIYTILKDLIGACLLSTRKSQTRGFTSKYPGFFNYESETGFLNINESKIIVQLESILRIIGNGVPLIIDEFKSILAIINTLVDPVAITRKLAQLMREASYIVLLDCFIEQQDIDIFSNIIRNFMDDQDWTVKPYINGYKHRTNQKVTIYRDIGFKNSDIQRVINQIIRFCEQSKTEIESPNNMGRCVSFVASASKVGYITEALRKIGLKVGDYTGLDECETINYLGVKMKMIDKKKLEFPQMDEVSKHYNVVIYSQTITVGLDIQNESFKYAVHYFKNKTGNQIQFLQGMFRFRQVTEHVVYSNCMVNWQLSVSWNKTIAQGYKLLLQDEDYFKDTRVDKLATLIQIYADSFFHCLGLLDIDYAIAKLQYSGHQVIIGDSETDQEPVQIIKQIHQQQPLPSELLQVKKEADFDGFQQLSTLSVEQIVELIEIHISDRGYNKEHKQIYKTSEGRNYKNALKLYNAYYSSNLLKDINIPQGGCIPVGAEYRKNMINPSKRATDLKAFIDFNNKASQYNRLVENLEARTVFRDHFNAVQVLNEFPDYKYRLKTLSVKNKQHQLKPKGSFSQSHLDRLLEKLQILEQIEPNLFKSLDYVNYNKQKPENLMNWCLRPENIKSNMKATYFQILGYQVQSVNNSTELYWKIQPIGNQEESLIWRLQIIEKKISNVKKQVAK